MKKLGILALFVMAAQLAVAQFNNPGEYLDAIGEEYRTIQKEMWDYTSAAAHGKSTRTVERKRMNLLETTRNARNKVRSMQGYEGNTAYRDSVVSFLDIYYLVLNEDYAEIVNMEEIAEQSYDAMEAYMLAKAEASKKLSSASEMLIEEQNKFAENFNVELMDSEDDELNKKMKVAEEVYAYYNEIYLIFFKSYVTDIYLSEAVNKEDVSAIEQQRSALSEASKEGLAMLENIDPFNGDNSLVVNCRIMLEFYQDQADNQIQHITNYFIKTENFETIKASFDQKSQGDRTQQDIDQYNKAVNDVNEASSKYNSTNQTIYENRKKYIGQWNDAVEKFTDKHVPRG